MTDYLHSDSSYTTGPWIDSRPYPNLAAAVSDAGSNNATILVCFPISIGSTNLNVPSNVTLRVIPPGSIQVPQALTLTINGGLEAGHHAVFTFSGDSMGLVTGPAQVSQVLPEWFGAKKNDSSFDNKDAFQRAIAFCQPSNDNHRVVEISSGWWYFAQALNLAGIDNLTLQGVSTSGGTLLTIRNGLELTGPFLDLTNTSVHSRIRIRNIFFFADALTNAGYADYAIQARNSPYLTIEQCRFVRFAKYYAISLESCWSSQVLDCEITVTGLGANPDAGGGGLELTGECHQFELSRCEISRAKTYGMWIGQGNWAVHVFSSDFEANKTAIRMAGRNVHVTTCYFEGNKDGSGSTIQFEDTTSCARIGECLFNDNDVEILVKDSAHVYNVTVEHCWFDNPDSHVFRSEKGTSACATVDGLIWRQNHIEGTSGSFWDIGSDAQHTRMTILDPAMVRSENTVRQMRHNLIRTHLLAWNQLCLNASIAADRLGRDRALTISEAPTSEASTNGNIWHTLARSQVNFVDDAWCTFAIPVRLVSYGSGPINCLFRAGSVANQRLVAVDVGYDKWQLVVVQGLVPSTATDISFYIYPMKNTIAIGQPAFYKGLWAPEYVIVDSVPLALTAAPTTGNWEQGETVWNKAPSAGGYMGWVCVTAGTPGTWKTFGPVSV